MFRVLYLLIFLSACSYFEAPPSDYFEPIETLPESSLPPKQAETAKEKVEEVKTEETPIKEIPEATSLKVIPRTIISLWSSKASDSFARTTVFGSMEFPLNFLGFKVEYVDIEKGLPDLSERNDVVGIISWFPTNFILPQIDTYLRWSITQIDAGKKFIVVGSTADLSKQGEAVLVDELWNKLGVSEPNDWVTFTYDYEIAYQDPSLFPFERKIPAILPQFLSFQLLPDGAESLVTLRSKSNPKRQATTCVINKNGALLSENYILYTDPALFFSVPKWLLNPFTLFRRIFDSSAFPVPDPTTLAGRRVYYSQIDGDGWNNISLTQKQDSNNPLYSSQVILKEIVETSPDLPITVAPIAAEIDLKWFGTEKSRDIAKSFFVLPQVEVGSHTFTHPFDWNFFENYTAKKEIPYLNNYPNRTFQSSPLEFLKAFKIKPSSYYSIGEGESAKGLQKGYVIPRAYALEPFSAELEVLGAIDEVNQITPPNKKVEIYQWSGNGEAFARVIELTVKAGVQNINGATNRFDFLVPTYCGLRPHCTTLAGVHQVFNSNSNENEYTNLWTKNYFAFATVTNTFTRTETPIRVKPIDHYYHMYSGERQASLSALKRNIEFIKTQKLCPIHASDYSKSVLGFYSTEIFQASEDEWLIANRGSLQTLRVDHAVFKGVDFIKSKGVIGQKHLQGSLYIALEPQDDTPIVALKEIEDSFEEPREPLFYLIDSRWNISDVQQDNMEMVQFQAKGFGNGEMVWNVPQDGRYEIVFIDENEEEVFKSSKLAKEQKLIFEIAADGLYPLKGTIFLSEALDE